MYDPSAGEDGPSSDRSSRGGPWRRVTLLAGATALVLLTGAVAVAAYRDEPAAPRWRAAPAATTPAVVPPTTVPPTTGPPTPTPAPRAISLSATGDIIMGDVPGRLPARGGRGFFDGVRDALAADLVMGNLEEPLTVDTGHAKCRPGSTGCHQFRAPPEYAAHLRDGGFEVLNQANNHGNDYGPAGYRNTQRALEKYGLRHTGAPDQVTVVDVAGVRVAVVGFSSYRWSNNLLNIAAAKRVVRRAAAQAQIVVVQVHMGAEGSGRTHVKPGSEIFLGEDRGDPVRFSHAVIDAGADLVVGHGPHVLRALEFYRGRLIAYSLGNFAGGAGTLRNDGRLGWGGVLKVSLLPDGGWSAGEFIATYMNDAGKPVLDPDRRGLQLAAELSADDFPRSGARLGERGDISPPPTD
ncbi:MAG TPA: CapA family protein [Pilimelia sp.]|nr:CapA family protein [Pilimelia sp.]